MIPVNELRSGACFQADGHPYRVIEYKHVKMGRGNANIKIKARNLKNGSVLERSYLSGSRVEDIDVIRNKVQYLYSDTSKAYFMDPKSFEQFEIVLETLGDTVHFVIEGMELELLKWEEQILGAELPNSVILTVSETGPSERGDSAGSVTKPAVLETGYSIHVPMFIKNGDQVKVDTRTGTYIERVS